jgi:superfamily II DNA or RNA helicase
LIFFSDKLYIPINEVDAAFNELVKAFSYPNPKYFTNKRLGYSVKSIPATVYNYYYVSFDDVKYLVVPRGAIQKVIDILKQFNISIPIEDRTLSFKDLIDIEFTQNKTLSRQQVTLIHTWTSHRGGLIQMGCGGGKTIACLGFISVVKQPTLIIVHTSKLQKQWLGELRECTEGSYALGELSGTKKIMGDVVVAVIDSVCSICSINSDNPDYSYLNNFGVLILDECQHLPATTFKNIVDNSKSTYRIGVTGTPTRKDKMHFLLYDSLGPILTEIKDSDLRHRITDFTTAAIYTNMSLVAPTRKFMNTKSSSKPMINLDYTKLVEILTEDATRNKLIIDAVIKDIQEGYKPLILTSRIAHAEHLYEELSKLFKGYLVIYKTNNSVDLKVVAEDLDLNFVVANDKIASEGLDIPQLSALHTTLPTTNMEKLKQQLGRIRRVDTVTAKPLPKYTDYVDRNVLCVSFDPKTKQESHVPIFLIGYNKRVKYLRKLHSEYWD